MFLLYLLVAILVRKQSKACLPLCERHRKRRTMGSLICSAVFVAGFVGVVAGLAVPKSANVIGGLIASASAIFILGSLIAAAVVTRLFHPVRMTETHAFYAGAGAAFLNGLPKWPGA